MEKIQKHAVFIVSAGSTGTTFFGETLKEMIPDSYSVHEPDVIIGLRDNVMKKIHDFGLHQAVIGKLFGTDGISNLSLNYISKKISHLQLVNKIHKSRNTYYNTIDKPIIIEAYYGWYGVLPGIRDVFSNYKIVVILRDPREWVRTEMNARRKMYGPRNIRYILKLKTLNPNLTGDTKYAERWKSMNRFEKLCWAWRVIYSILLKEKDDEHVLVIKFEDIFQSKNRYNELKRLLSFLTDFPSKKFEYKILEGILENHFNRSTGDSFPEWQQWNPGYIKYLHSVCFPLMGKFGYGQEVEWREIVNHSSI